MIELIDSNIDYLDIQNHEGIGEHSYKTTHIQMALGSIQISLIDVTEWGDYIFTYQGLMEWFWDNHDMIRFMTSHEFVEFFKSEVEELGCLKLTLMQSKVKTSYDMFVLESVYKASDYNNGWSTSLTIRESKNSLEKNND